ncbi:MAG: class I SAM-dependent methyltransferase [Clostridium fessum]
MRTEVKLSKRLERIASFVQPGSRVADIGTDHGYVPIWLVQKGVCPSALAMDVRKGPLERAEEHVEEVGLSGKIELRLSDGLAKLKAGEADTVVIAGMGGKLTCRILEQGRHVWENWSEGKERLILSPQSEQDEVRHFLEEQGFSILREAMLTERGKILHSDRSGARHDAAGERAGLPFWSRFDPEERSGAACVSGERREDDAAGAGRADRK